MAKKKEANEIKLDDAAIRREKNKLSKIFKNLSPDKLTIVNGLIESAAFMKVFLDVLTHDIKSKGHICILQQSKDVEGFPKERPEVGSFNKTLTNYNKVINSLISYLPKDEAKAASDALDDFLNDG
jgi:hypothetical protein